MKNLIIFSLLALLPISTTLLADTSLWSDSFHFDGNAITEEPIVLKETDPLAYSSAMTDGSPKFLTITVVDKTAPEKTASIFADYSEKPVEGTTTWDYTDEDYKDFPTDDTYILTETVVSDLGSKVFTRFVTIIPEPTFALFFGIMSVLLLRMRVKRLLAVVALIATSAFSANAVSSVTEVSCMQMWPFDRSVIVNFTVESDYTNGLDVKFYGSTNNGETSFELGEKGTLMKDGSDGTIDGAGKYKAIWVPDETFYGTVIDEMKIMVEVAEKPKNLYMVVDLTSGDICYLESVPEGGWTDEYKTTKIVLRKIEAGTFTMGSPEDELGRYDGEVQHEVTLTKDFYIAIFQTTQKQYETITGKTPSYYKGEMRPVECVSYNWIRGSMKGAGWPANNDVDEDSFLGELRTRTNKSFDLPTEAQWEYACRAGTTTALNDGNNLTNFYEDGNLNKLGRYYCNQKGGKGGYNTGTTTVGSYLPNAWGLYDMHGNVWEWCLDWHGGYDGDATDPKGPAEGTSRIIRGSSYYFSIDGRLNNAGPYCRSAYRGGHVPSYLYDHSYGGGGFRVALIP